MIKSSAAKRRKQCINYALMLAAAMGMSACSTPQVISHLPQNTRPLFVPTPSTAVSMSCANHTDGYIHSYGVQEPLTMAKSIIYALNCQPHEMGGGVVAAGFTLPDQWQPGMKVKVRWKPNARDWIEKTTTIRWYATPERLFVHFFANDEVRVLSSSPFPRSTLHPILMNVTIAPPEEE